MKFILRHIMSTVYSMRISVNGCHSIVITRLQVQTLCMHASSEGSAKFLQVLRVIIFAQAGLILR